MSYARKIGEKESKQIVEMYTAGQTSIEIAAKLGVNPATVRTALHAAGVPLDMGPRLSESVLQQMIELYAAGHSSRAIARQLGLERASVRSNLYRRGIKAPKLSAKMQQKIIDLCKVDNFSVPLVSKQLGLGPALVRRVLLQHGIVPQRIGYKRHPITNAQTQEIVELYGQGVGTEELAAKYKISSGTVQNWLKKLGVCLREPGFRTGENHHDWQGGRIVKSGYVFVLVHEGEPYYEMAQMKAGTVKYVPEHRLVMARSLGRCLTKHETVHHKDGDPSNNDLGNLQLRTGNHGRGASFHCQDCGSYNVAPEELKEPSS